MNALDRLLKERKDHAEIVSELDAAIRELQDDVTAGPAAVSYADFDSEALEFEWLLGGLIAAQTISMIVADPGIGKSTLMAQMTLAAATGKTFLGANVSAPMRVLMLQAEGSRAAFRARTRAARHAMATDPPNLWYIQAPDFTDYQIGGDGLRRAVMESGARLAVLDTMPYFARFNENDAEQWREKVLKPLRRLVGETGASIVLVHHQPKMTESNRENRDGRGTSAMLGDCDHFWRLETVKEDAADGTSAGSLRDFVVRKNKYGAEYTSRLSFDAGNAIFRVVGGL